MNPIFTLLALSSFMLCAFAQDHPFSKTIPQTPDMISDDTAETFDGIIRPHQLVSSLVLQTHGNQDRNAATDILSSYFLRDHITTHAEAFKYLGSEEEFFFPWALPVSSQSKVVDHEKVKSRYNLVKRKVPQFRYKYEYVTKTVYVREGATSSRMTGDSSYGGENRSSAGRMVKRTMRTREVVSARQVGFRTCTVKCPNPNGKYEEELLRPITKKEGIAVLPRGWHAANAQLAFSIIKAGLPAEDPQIGLITRSFNNILYAYGIPDCTTDVAWLTALYANLPQENLGVKEWTSRLTSRLVAGAAQTGSNPGMWGPVCINREYIEKIVAHDAEIVEKQLTPLRRAVMNQTHERRKQRLEQELAELESQYEDWQRTYLIWAMSGSAVHHPRKKTVIPADSQFQQELFFNYSLHVPGLVHNPYQFQFTDIESTSLALFALNEVHQAGLLPEQTLAPQNMRKKEMSKPINVSNVLTSCLNTLLRLRLKDGGWNSCYSVTNHRVSRTIPYTSILPKNIYEQIIPEEHWSYHVMGLASMEYLARMHGEATAERIRSEIWQRNTELIKWMIDNLDAIDLTQIPSQNDIRYFLADIIASRNPESQLVWRMIGANDIAEMEKLTDFNTAQIDDTHSARAAIEAEQAHFLGKNNAIDDWSHEVDDVNTLLTSGLPSLQKRAAIIYFLAKGIRQPVFAYIHADRPRSSCPALMHLMNANEATRSLNHFSIQSLEDIQYYADAFFLVLEEGSLERISQEGRSMLSEYIGDGGTVVFLGSPGKGTLAMRQIASDILGSTGADVQERDHQDRGGKCVEYHLEGRLAWIVLDAEADVEPRTTYSNRLKIYQSLMPEKLPADFLSKSYSILSQRSTNAELTLTGVEWNQEAE
jgi:hypothetical protein